MKGLHFAKLHLKTLKSKTYRGKPCELFKIIYKRMGVIFLIIALVGLSQPSLSNVRVEGHLMDPTLKDLRSFLLLNTPN